MKTIILTLTGEQMAELQPLRQMLFEDAKQHNYKAGMLIAQPCRDGNNKMPVKFYSYDEALRIVEAAGVVELNLGLGLIDE